MADALLKTSFVIANKTSVGADPSGAQNTGLDLTLHKKLKGARNLRAPGNYHLPLLRKDEVCVVKLTASPNDGADQLGIISMQESWVVPNIAG